MGGVCCFLLQKDHKSIPKVLSRNFPNEIYNKIAFYENECFFYVESKKVLSSID